MSDLRLKRWAVSIPLSLFMMMPTYQLPSISFSTATVSLEVNTAYARRNRAKARRAIRRTVRRTTRRAVRRHAYYRTLPPSCRVSVISGITYWYCGGVYYRQIVENGATVYIIVNP